MPWANYPPKLKLLRTSAITSGFSTSLTAVLLTWTGPVEKWSKCTLEL